MLPLPAGDEAIDLLWFANAAAAPPGPRTLCRQLSTAFPCVPSTAFPCVPTAFPPPSSVAPFSTGLTRPADPPAGAGGGDGYVTARLRDAPSGAERAKLWALHRAVYGFIEPGSTAAAAPPAVVALVGGGFSARVAEHTTKLAAVFAGLAAAGGAPPPPAAASAGSVTAAERAPAAVGPAAVDRDAITVGERWVVAEGLSGSVEGGASSFLVAVSAVQSW